MTMINREIFVSFFFEALVLLFLSCSLISSNLCLTQIFLVNSHEISNRKSAIVLIRAVSTLVALKLASPFGSKYEFRQGELHGQAFTW